MNYNSRNEVPEQYRWDLTKWFKTDEEWEEEYKEAKKHTNDLKKYKGKIFEDDNLYNLLNEFYEYNNKLDKLYVYAFLKQDEDLSVNKYSKMYQQMIELFSDFSENISFVMPEILHSSKFNVDKLISDCPKLERFRHILEEYALDKEYIKDEKTEELITVMTKDLSHYDNVASTLLNSDIDYGEMEDENGKKVKLNTGNISHFLASSNRDIRKNVYIEYNKKKAQFSNTLGKNLIAFMDRHSTIAKIRGYKNTKDMDFKNDHIPVEVHTSLLKNIDRGIPIFRKFLKILKDMLQVDTLEAYDLYAPVSNADRKYTVEEAKEYVYNATSILGEQYSEIMKKGFDEHWIDYMPYKGKQSGGYCCSVYGNTSNILMSFNGDFTDISTIAHEMGHAVHAYFGALHNSVEYAHHTYYTVEIPSLLNEILLAHYIIENDFSKEEKISVIVDMLSTINRNSFTAVMENELENIVYEKIDNGESLSTEDLNDIMEQLLIKYYGDTLNFGEYKKYMWTSRSHYFEPWYLYKYATCLCGAVHFATKILKKDKDTLEVYNNYLKSGTDCFPNELLLKHGIDLTKESTYDELFEYYESLLTKLQELLK